MSGLTLYNTLTRRKEAFTPIDEKNVRMYVCGPTVYDFAHIGNARPVIVFDVLYRLLRHVYGADHVTYVRNITDVDDKINARALRDFGAQISAGEMTLNQAIREVTEKTADQFHADVKALGCLEPTHEPRATEHIEGMVAMINDLIAKGHAYIAKGGEGREVLFDVVSMPAYGKLSNRKLEDQQAGARVDAKDHKKNPGDFVLWKESAADEPGWDGTFEITEENRAELNLNSTPILIRGRPGWHIECSVMSQAHLGEVFDIHGGGLDLIFPHHENEIAQSCCAHGTDRMANVWMHNGYLQVEGKKMSKSEGNFVTIHDLLHTDKFGGRKWPGEVLRLAMLMTHYREPIDFSVKRLEEAETILSSLYRHYSTLLPEYFEEDGGVFDFWLSSGQLYNDLDIPGAIKQIQSGLRISLHENDEELLEGRDIDDARATGQLYISGYVKAAKFLGLLNHSPSEWEELRLSLRTNASKSEIQVAVNERLAFIREKNWAEADRIRDELMKQGIQLKDGKDPESGERITSWEVKR